jgi:hypothetical protein
VPAACEVQQGKVWQSRGKFSDVADHVCIMLVATINMVAQTSSCSTESRDR